MISVTYLDLDDRITVTDGGTPFYYDLDQVDAQRMFWFQTPNIFNVPKNSSTSRQDDHEKKNRMDTVKDGKAAGTIDVGVRVESTVKQIVRTLGLYNYDADELNYISPDNKSKVLENYFNNNLNVLESLTVLNMSRDGNRNYIPNYNTTQSYTHVCFDAGILWEKYIPKLNVIKVGTLGSYIDPASGCNTNITEHFPESDITIELDNLFCAMIGLGTNTTITGKYIESSSQWAYNFSIGGVQHTSAAQKVTTPIIIERTDTAATNNDDDTNVDDFFSGNASKNEVLKQFIIGPDNQAPPNDKLTVIKLLLGKQMGDALQVMFTLIYHIRYKGEGRIITLTTCDSIVFMTCLMLKVPCIFNPMSIIKCVALNNLVDNNPTTLTPKSKSFEYYPTVMTALDIKIRQIELLKAYNIGVYDTLATVNIDRSRITKAFTDLNFKPRINIHYFKKCVLAMVTELNRKISLLDTSIITQKLLDQYKFIPFFRIVYKKNKRKPGYWAFTIPRNNLKICKDKIISDPIVLSVLNISRISTIEGELGRTIGATISHFDNIIGAGAAGAGAGAGAAGAAAGAAAAAAAAVGAVGGAVGAVGGAATIGRAAEDEAEIYETNLDYDIKSIMEKNFNKDYKTETNYKNINRFLEINQEINQEINKAINSSSNQLEKGGGEKMMGGAALVEEADDGFSIFKMITYRLYFYYLMDLDSPILEYEPFIEFVLYNESKNLPLFPNKADYDSFKVIYLNFFSDTGLERTGLERTEPESGKMDVEQNNINQNDFDYIAGSSDYPTDIYQVDFYTSFGIDIEHRPGITIQINEMAECIESIESETAEPVGMERAAAEEPKEYSRSSKRPRTEKRPNSPPPKGQLPPRSVSVSPMELGGGRKTRKKTKSSQLRKTLKKRRVKKIKRKSLRRRKPIKKRVNSKNRKVKRKIKNKTRKYKKPKKQKRSRKPNPKY